MTLTKSDRKKKTPLVPIIDMNEKGRERPNPIPNKSIKKKKANVRVGRNEHISFRK